MKELVARDNPVIVMGLESQDILGTATSRLLNWGEAANINVLGRNYKIHFLPSCHWSGRGMFDHFKRLWGGFLVTTPEGKKIYYPGDTGYE